jgi:hypothetical protein
MEKLFYITKKASNDTIAGYLEKGPPDLRDRIVPISYEYLLSTEKGPVGNYLFTDIDRASRAEIEKAVRIAHAITNAGHGCRVINWPNSGCMRYELLRRLYERGINPFNVYRYTEARMPARFPVFVRRLSEHTGSFSALIDSPELLERMVDRILKLGYDRDDLLIVEFVDTRSPDGLYRKYGSSLIAGEVFGSHLIASDSWNVKQVGNVDDALIDEEIDFFQKNSFADEVRAVFALARIDFGRLDFAVVGGRMHVWEINTNPNLYGGGFDRYPERLRRALTPYYLPKVREGFLRLLRPQAPASASEVAASSAPSPATGD